MPGFCRTDKFKDPPKAKSGLKGVIHFPLGRKPWKAYIRHRGEYRVIGYFETLTETAKAYNRECLRLKGPSDYFNPIPVPWSA